MPIIESSTRLRNSYNEISALCHEYDEPIYVTKNGQGDLAVMSISYYESLIARKELYELLDVGADDIRSGAKRPYREVFADVKDEAARAAL